MSDNAQISFGGKVALVTGGARGLGFAIARRLAAGGASVALLDLNLEAAEAAASTLRETGATALGLLCDVASEESMAAAVHEAESALGGVDLLVANAGLHLQGYVMPVLDMTLSDWRRLLDVNVLGIVNGAKVCREPMRRRGGGAIVTIASMAGYKAENAYGISKLAVRGLTVALARDLGADGIRVCGIAPGLIGTDEVMAKFPAERRERYVNEVQFVRRLGSPEDIANAAAFLLSDEASFVTGETLLVTGGAYCRI